MEKKIPVKTLYLLLVISLGLVGLGIGSTYAVFTASAEIESPISLSSNLTYDSSILEIVEVTVGGGETKSTTLNINNNSDSALNYVTWYMDEEKDVEVVGENDSSSGTVASGSTSTVVVSVRNYSYETETVTIGISSSGDNVVLGNDMKQVEDVNFLMSYSSGDTVSASTSFLGSAITREQVNSITFVDNVNVPSGYTSVDVSKHNNGSILMWYGTPNEDGNYDVYIGSNKGKTYVDSGYKLLGYLSNCTSFNFNDLAEVSKVINMTAMFIECGKIINLDVNAWDTSNVQKMQHVFSNCISLVSLDISEWDTSKVTTMMAMFQICISLQSLDLSGWNVSNVTDMSYMFCSTKNYGDMVITSIGDVSDWNTSNVTTMQAMFQKCVSLTYLALNNWDTSSVTNISYMFNDCYSLTNLDLSDWNTSNVTTMQTLFADCNSLTYLDLSNWDTSKVENMKNMFSTCRNLNTIYASDKWSTASVTASADMFKNCTSLVGGSGTAFNSSNVDATYAKVDGGISDPGYFTYKASV